MVQIDERIPEGPTYTYHVDAVPSSNTQWKRKAGGSITVGTPVVHRGSFTCIATMRVQSIRKGQKATSFERLQESGVGGTKREARHTASAKLLAKLFPECEGMVAVKKAAEAAREKYAASKALKQQSRRDRFLTDARGQVNESDKTKPLYSFAFASPKSPSLPVEVEEHLLRAVGAMSWKREQVSKEELAPESKGVEADLSRQHSRQQQLDDSILYALQSLNEHDEDGRSLPDELTVDDVGRTVLRRATHEDEHWITKLLGTSNSMISPIVTLSNSKGSARDEFGRNNSPFAARLWSSSAIVLLLCRAIAPYDDPPLGCATLTLGFSLEKGRTLRIAQIASESHLPLERFREVLQSFANHMTCFLEPSSPVSPSYMKLQQDDIDSILNSHLSIPPDCQSRCDPNSPESEKPLVLSPLQSVIEESEALEESDSEKGKTNKKVTDKPSKRSRVE